MTIKQIRDGLRAAWWWARGALIERRENRARRLYEGRLYATSNSISNPLEERKFGQ